LKKCFLNKDTGAANTWPLNEERDYESDALLKEENSKLHQEQGECCHLLKSWSQ
jgi:hypothetical protein